MGSWSPWITGFIRRLGGWDSEVWKGAKIGIRGLICCIYKDGNPRAEDWGPVVVCIREVGSVIKGWELWLWLPLRAGLSNCL